MEFGYTDALDVETSSEKGRADERLAMHDVAWRGVAVRGEARPLTAGKGEGLPRR